MAGLLLRASLEGAVAIAVVAIVSFALARNAPAFRCRLWWVACCKLLVGLAGIAPLSIPILPAVVSIASPAALRTGSIAAAGAVGIAPSPQAMWPGLLLALWASGAFIACALVARRYLQTRGILRRARPNPDAKVTALAEHLSKAVGVRRAPRLVYSDDVATPQVAGLLAPTILLPSEQVRTFSQDELAMALCHELVHVRRRDLGWGWVPAIAARIFFFHPGAIMAAREYALAREQACDAEVLRVMGVAPVHYGQLLVALSAEAPRALAPAVGVSSSFRHLRRRLGMLEIATQKAPHRPTRWVVLALLAATILVPFRLSARTPRQQADLKPAAGDAYVLFLDENSVTMSGSLDDLAVARAHRDRAGAQMLWFRQAGKEYVVTDPKLLRSVVSAQHDDVARQASARDAELDSERMALEARLEALTKHRDDLDDAAREEELTQAARYAADADRERQRAELERELSRASRAGTLSVQQEALARDVERAAMEADRRVRELLEESVRSGAAHPSGLKGGVKDGVKGGVQGGVEGGVEGGVDTDEGVDR